MTAPASTSSAPPPPPGPEGESPEAREVRLAKHWMEHVYVGDRVPQLTVRAVITGMALGGVMALSNLYVGMKTGWGLGVTITACILAFAIFSTLQKVLPGLRENHFTMLENNMMSSAASAAGYMSSSIFVSAVPALYLASGKTVGWFELTIWAAAVSALGVFMAIPMKRQQINVDQLPFPSGIATAETIKALHATGGDANKKAASLGIAAVLGAAVGWLRDAGVPLKLPEKWIPSASVGGQSFERLTIGVEWSFIMVGAGVLIGIRVGLSMLVGAAVCYVVLGPWVLNAGWVDLAKYRQQWALWPGVGILVASGMTSFLLRWRSIVRAFSGIGRLLGIEGEHVEDPAASVEAPQPWFLWGTLLSGAACVLIGAIYFEIAWWMGILAVVLTFFLALVASRATGETDITPTGAMGKITQLLYGVVAPGNMTTNLMTASLTGGAAIHTADLITDLKSGYILGANPRKQLIAQLWGVLAGTFFVVPAYYLLIKPEEIGTDKWPAPAAQIWAGVAKVLAQGLDALPTGATSGLLVGCGVGAVLALIEEFVPKRYKRFTLSATGFGMAWVVPFWNSFSIFLGGLIAWMIAKKDPEAAGRYNFAVASGFIAGESLIAIVVAALIASGVLGGH